MLESDLEFQHIDLIGGDPGEGILAAKFGVWFALHELIFISPRAANFGGDYIIQKKVTQPQLPDMYPAPPPGLGGSKAAKSYSYTIRLEPCPNKGRNVKRC